MDKTDLLVRDKKRLPLSGPEVFSAFSIHLFGVLPIWLFVLCPSAVALSVANGIGRIFYRPTSDRQKEIVAADIPAQLSTAPRKFELVVFGATGFTGKLACLYIAKQYGQGLTWAIAGRRKEALEAVRKDLGNEYSNLPIILADSADMPSLEAMVAMTKVVISTAGPFALYGTELVAACAKFGTHYCDITGETDWTRETIDKFDGLARKSGARIVHFCGHDCVPWDLSVLALSKELQRKGDVLTEVRCYDEIRSKASGGTMATVFNALGNRKKLKTSLPFDPLLKTPAGEKSSAKFTAKLQKYLGYSSEIKKWVGPFVMAPVMANCVKRTNALLGLSPKLSYYEACVYPNFMAAFVSNLRMVVLGTIITVPQLRWLALKANLLPSPGQGPSNSEMDKGFLRITAVGVGAKSKARSVFYFPTDPGYRDTARMVVESGLVLALEGEKLKPGGGVYTPAACLGDALMQRLVATGCHFAIE